MLPYIYDWRGKSSPFSSTGKENPMEGEKKKESSTTNPLRRREKGKVNEKVVHRGKEGPFFFREKMILSPSGGRELESRAISIKKRHNFLQGKRKKKGWAIGKGRGKKRQSQKRCHFHERTRVSSRGGKEKKRSICSRVGSKKLSSISGRKKETDKFGEIIKKKALFSSAQEKGLTHYFGSGRGTKGTNLPRERPPSKLEKKKGGDGS